MSSQTCAYTSKCIPDRAQLAQFCWHEAARGLPVQAIESAVRKKKQILLSEAELRQRAARGTPERRSLLQRLTAAVQRGDGGGAGALTQSIATLQQEVAAGFRVLMTRQPVTCRQPHYQHAAFGAASGCRLHLSCNPCQFLPGLFCDEVALMAKVLLSPPQR